LIATVSTCLAAEAWPRVWFLVLHALTDDPQQLAQSVVVFPNRHRGPEMWSCAWFLSEPSHWVYERRASTDTFSDYLTPETVQVDKKTPLQKPWYDSTESSHQCTHLSLLNWDVKSELRAHSLLCDEAALTDRVREFFVADGSTHDRLRASNRRQGIASSQELFIGEWLFTTWSYGNKQAEDRFLTIERFRGDVRLLTETVARHKSVCVREADNQWCIVTE
jgi:hypothetical protein